MKTIGRYRIAGLLGRGSMGKVYRVVLPAIGKIAALKLLAPDPLIAKLMGTQTLRRMFVKEAQTMASLRHPNIVGVQDFDEDRGRLFYTMDYHANNLGVMIGESFRADQQSRMIAVDRSLDYTRQTLCGLARLHDAGIIHRDIKPFNLLVTDWDTIEICDFGLSKLRGETFPGPSNLNVGSPFYAAPEQVKSPDRADQRADLYPVGVMLYRMLTGSLPPETDSPEDRISMGELRTELDAAWDDFIQRALAPAPDRRFRDAADMLKALDNLTAHWREQTDRICALPQEHPRSVAGPVKALRRKPAKFASAKARAVLDLDELWRPNQYTANEFQIQSDSIVWDRATGLAWQQSGSSFPLNWRQAGDYIEALNSRSFAGRTNWRLPTIEELITLLRPADRPGDPCIEPLFDPTQRRLWSCDRKSFAAVYFADVDLGFIGWHDASALCHVRAVSA